MPGPVQLSDLVTRVRRRADMENSTFCSDSEIEQYIQDSYGDLVDQVLASGGGDAFVSTSSEGTTSAGTSSYTIYKSSNPANEALVYKVLLVEVKLGGEWRKVRPIARGRQAEFVDSDGTWTHESGIRYTTELSTEEHWGSSAYYRQISFYPTPPGGKTFRVHYVPYPGAAASSEYIQGYTGWDEYVVVDAALKCLEKEESLEQVQMLSARRAQLLQRIMFAAATMDHESGGQVRDIDREIKRPWWETTV